MHTYTHTCTIYIKVYYSNTLYMICRYTCNMYIIVNIIALHIFLYKMMFIRKSNESTMKKKKTIIYGKIEKITMYQ